MKKSDGSISMNFQEIHQTLVEALKPIFARWDAKEEPHYSDVEELFGRFIPSEPMDAKRVTGVELRNTIQRWSNNAAAGADSWKRCEWTQFADTMYNQIAEYPNTIEETASEMNCKELIETPIRPEDIRTTPVANIKKGGGVTRTQRRAPHHLCSRALLRMVEHAIQRNDDVGQTGVAPQDCARGNPRSQSAE